MKWTDSLSHGFQVTNGVRQGAVYICTYLGIWDYAYVIILMSPSRNGLQEMTNKCEKGIESLP